MRFQLAENEIHVGLEEYYNRLNKYIADMNCILVEGFSYHTSRKPKKDIYKKYAQRLNLVTQTEKIELPDDLQIKPIDMTKYQISESLKKLKLLDRFNMKLFSMFINLGIPISNKRNKYILNVFYEDPTIRIDPLKIRYTENQILQGIDKFIMKDRDDVFRKNTQEYINENLSREYRYDIGIQVGISHMVAVYDILNMNGFSWRLEEEILAIDN